MGQVSSVLRRATGGYMHWCPACEETHPLPDGWQFNNNLDLPSFSPSFKTEYLKRVFVDGKWTGEWAKDANGEMIRVVCHYILTDGVLNFCGDCTHSFAGKSVPLPALPEHLID